MAGVISYSRKEAAALPLTRQTVDLVIARTRTANLVQLLISVVLVVGFLLAGRAVPGAPLAWLFYGGAALAMWGLLATALSTWDHFRAAPPLRTQAGEDIAQGRDPKKFWWAHRGLFPYFSR